ncbi:trimeric intracellular cation channel family protein [Paeniglutamicibacter kerguelensis]|uniref:Membrane protein YeiH n=1 Tax=Paeniglutamicibacter kerguelensis TaxID=254788 RepID=A0ABS4XGD7_9MICC|nr:TRIC cation channel family protein [Paeniglutamicibacter kerguelensis]MBP2387406.1 putative membrane protein YeiH [Paeniglutamicibacter kerguelensis]
MPLVLDLFGVFFFGVSGSLLAARRGFDIVGSLLLAGLTGIGGGIIRDVILGQTPTAFANPFYFIPPVLAALLVFFLAPGVQRMMRPLLVFDAAGLALFCITGTIKALESGMNPFASALLGVTSAVGGGLLRDVVANKTPELFNPRDIYAVPAMLGAGLIAGFWGMGLTGGAWQLAVAGVVFLLRLLALTFHWHVPRAVGPWHRDATLN